MGKITYKQLIPTKIWEFCIKIKKNMIKVYSI